MLDNMEKATDEIKKGVDINVKGYRNLTALHIAAINGKLIEIVVL